VRKVFHFSEFCILYLLFCLLSSEFFADYGKLPLVKKKIIDVKIYELIGLVA